MSGGGNVFEGPNFFGGLPLTIQQGSETITNTATLEFVSGATLASGGPGVALLSINGGGGGGSYAEGNGVTLYGTSPTTIGLTGNIAQQDNSGKEIYIQAAFATGTIANNYGQAATVNAGSASAATAGFTQGGGSFGMFAGGAYVSNIGVGGGNFQATGGYADTTGTNFTGGGATIASGAGLGTGSAGGIGILGADAVAQGSNVYIKPGYGATNGVLIVLNIGTTDPHILNAKWQSSVVGIGYVGVYSKG